jgi:branched-chain amino acid transport system permease protein
MPFVVSVIVLGCIYAVLAVGFVVIYKSSRVLNFSYADIAVMLAYLSITVVELISGPPVISLVIVLLISFFFGLGVHRFLIRPMAGQPIFSTIILTVAFGIVIQSVATLIWHGDTKTINLGWKAYYTLGGGIRISGVDIIILITAVVFYTGLLIFYGHSRIGWQMRATAENIVLAAQRGINVYSVTALSWGIGIFATAVAAMLLGSYSAVSLAMGHIAIKAFAVALVGGLDSIGGAIPAAFLIALVELGANTYINPRLADAIPFMIMLIVLLVRPWGLFGTEEEIERV